MYIRICVSKRESQWGLSLLRWILSGGREEETFIVTDGFLLKGHYYHDGKRQTERGWEEEEEVMKATRGERKETETG